MTVENLKCPTCDGPMVSRLNRTTEQRFWGCKDYPKCRGTRNTDGESPEEVRAKRNSTEYNSKEPSSRWDKD